MWFLSFLLFVWLTRETRKTKETKLTKTFRFGHLSIGIWDYVENNPNYPPSPLVASGPEEPLARRGEGEGEYAMSTPTSTLWSNGTYSTGQALPHQGGGELLLFS